MSERLPRSRSSVGAESKQRLHSMLSEALTLADALALPPEVGARLQEVIDMVEGPDIVGASDAKE